MQDTKCVESSDKPGFCAGCDEPLTIIIPKTSGLKKGPKTFTSSWKGRPKKLPAKDMPMGVSEWMRHGKKYGYWDYFKQQIAESEEIDVRESWTGARFVPLTELINLQMNDSKRVLVMSSAQRNRLDELLIGDDKGAIRFMGLIIKER